MTRKESSSRGAVVRVCERSGTPAGRQRQSKKEREITRQEDNVRLEAAVSGLGVAMVDGPSGRRDCKRAEGVERLWW